MTQLESGSGSWTYGSGRLELAPLEIELAPLEIESTVVSSIFYEDDNNQGRPYKGSAHMMNSNNLHGPKPELWSNLKNSNSANKIV